jgi:hypothetical protein
MLNTWFTKLERNFEILSGYFNNIRSETERTAATLDGPDIETVDMMFGGYDVTAHLGR